MDFQCIIGSNLYTHEYFNIFRLQNILLKRDKFYFTRFNSTFKNFIIQEYYLDNLFKNNIILVQKINDAQTTIFSKYKNR